MVVEHKSPMDSMYVSILSAHFPNQIQPLFLHICKVWDLRDMITYVLWNGGYGCMMFELKLSPCFVLIKLAEYTRDG